MLANRDNEIDNLLTKIHELQLQQPPIVPTAPAEDPEPSSDVDES
jgi:hypothetical protein